MKEYRQLIHKHVGGNIKNNYYMGLILINGAVITSKGEFRTG